MNKSLKNTQENQEKAIKQVNETVQDLKTKMEVIKKTQTEGWLDMENLGKRNRNYRNKYNQQNTRDGRKNLRH